ncbi:HD domain-containing protein [Tenacibaculum maritimum]|nr:HD domain-containing protein [Tenacibaculum maritimum]MDB0602100.1 HD domain-containing protein [Tenacibaculum maritimum]MDB0610814.1 HD domain-containing protein [Tenacibaculum maritimum]
MDITDTIYTENSIRTYTGKVFDLKILDPDSICIEDIAHALSHTARFAGHLPEMYSVAQHSVLVGSKCEREHKLAALLHDASEAYLGDMPSPFKKMMPEYKKIEDNLMQVIAKKFGFQYPLHPQVKHFDKEYLSLEWDSFVNGTDAIVIWDTEQAEQMFLDAFKFLTE